MTKSELV